MAAQSDENQPPSFFDIIEIKELPDGTVLYSFGDVDTSAPPKIDPTPEPTPESSKRSAVAGAMAEVASAVHEDERAAVVTAAGEASAESAASADHASATTAAPAVAVAIPERPPTRFVKRSPLKDAMARKLEAAAAAGEPSDDESELVEAATRWRSSLPPRLPSKFKRQFPRFQSRPRPGTHLTEVVLNLSGSAAAQEKQLEPAPVSDASVSAAEEVAVTQEEDVGDIEAVVEAAPSVNGVKRRDALEAMTAQDLKSLLKERKVRGYSRMRKAELVEFILDMEEIN
ncbi:unnamed protein product [Closterium sp. NIES-64]|nr:unnamed protein product [Closterium sp. NIES-64]